MNTNLSSNTNDILKPKKHLPTPRLQAPTNPQLYSNNNDSENQSPFSLESIFFIYCVFHSFFFKRRTITIFLKISFSILERNLTTVPTSSNGCLCVHICMRILLKCHYITILISVYIFGFALLLFSLQKRIINRP